MLLHSILVFDLKLDVDICRNLIFFRKITLMKFLNKNLNFTYVFFELKELFPSQYKHKECIIKKPSIKDCNRAKAIILDLKLLGVYRISHFTR